MTASTQAKLPLPDSGATVAVRKWVTHVEELLADGGREIGRPLRRVVVAAVIANPYAGEWSEDLELLQATGAVLGHELMARAIDVLGGPVEAYGKAGIVGERGELEHVAAVLHPRFGKPTRSLAEGLSILPSVKKRGGQGAVVDVPVHHKTAMLIRSHFDSVEFRVPDAPCADELVIALGVTDGPRPFHRVGGLREEDAEGVDGLR